MPTGVASSSYVPRDDSEFGFSSKADGAADGVRYSLLVVFVEVNFV